jgi:hypothetical protein
VKREVRCERGTCKYEVGGILSDRAWRMRQTHFRFARRSHRKQDISLSLRSILSPRWICVVRYIYISEAIDALASPPNKSQLRTPSIFLLPKSLLYHHHHYSHKSVMSFPPIRFAPFQVASAPSTSDSTQRSNLQPQTPSTTSSTPNIATTSTTSDTNTNASSSNPTSPKSGK